MGNYVALAREYERAYKATDVVRPSQKDESSLERAAFLPPRTEAISLEGTGRQLEIAHQCLAGTISDEIRGLLYSVARRLKAGVWGRNDPHTLRYTIGLVVSLPTDVLAVDWDVTTGDAKEDVLRLLNLALATITRLRG